MKLYFAAGQYVGTQAEAKALTKDFAALEVPTDKEGLITYLNSIIAAQHIDTPDRVVKDINDDVREFTGNPVSYAERSVAIDETFHGLPIEHQLTLTSLALENARTEIGRLKGDVQPPRGWIVHGDSSGVIDIDVLIPVEDDDGLFS